MCWDKLFPNEIIPFIISKCFPNIKNLQFADDVIFFGEWKSDNIKNLIKILSCFHQASGLKINIHKIKLYEVGVPKEEIAYWTQNLGCGEGTLPFNYLGLPVGAAMNRIESWKPVIEKMKIKLSAWRANAISTGGRLTLTRSVLGSTSLYFFSLFRAPKGVLSELERIRKQFFGGGGLGDKRKVSWVNWDTTISSWDKGG